ncbi:MAG: hypothetical protein IPJ19_09340 [Planctomycetes bacterium]|nr:hypothetical protein [Planctomycetota bacterium]
MRRILHVDVDAFLASVEQAVHPELAGKAVVIGGLPTDRNLVMSCSYEARALGVRPGMLLAEAAKRCPRAVFRRGDSQAAGRLREGVARILLRFTPRVEIASIDDFFADLGGTQRLHGEAFAVAEQVRALVRSELRLPVTIGVATNRTLARIAGKLAKPGGVAEILPGMEERFLALLPVAHLPGAGHKIGRELQRYAIRTCGELVLVPREILYTSFGRAGLVLHERARGIDPEPVESSITEDEHGALVLRPPLSIRRDSTFEPEEGRRELVEAMLGYLVERAAQRLRGFARCTSSLAVRVAYVDTRAPALRRVEPSEPAEFEKRARLEPSDSTDELLRRALALFRELPRRRALVKRVGLTLEGFTPRGGHQLQLFDECQKTSPPGFLTPAPTDAPTDEPAPEPRESRADRLQRLERTVDALREKHGFGGVLRATSLLLADQYPLGKDGLRLRTPSLNQ